MERNEMSGTCSTYGGEERFRRKSMRKRDHLEELNVDGRIMLKWNLRSWMGCRLDSGKWQAVAKKIFKF
jgi:hypothetical protein